MNWQEIKNIQEVKTRPVDFLKYKKITPQIFKECVALAKKLQGKKIIHINSTQLGGGVSELLRSQIPLERSLGLNSHWFIIEAPIRFFRVTKKIHDLLQGKEGILKDAEKYFYLKWLYSQIAPSFEKIISQEKPAIVVIHDPQPLPLIDYISGKTIPILRMHIDLSLPNPSILKFLQPLVGKYKLVILSHPKYRPAWLSAKKTRIIMPAINPFNPKNRPIRESYAKNILNLYNVDTSRPIVSQVSRFDPWKDPLGVIKAYRLAKKQIPELQLILSGIAEARDDPQSIEVFEKVYKKTKDDPDAYLFFDPKKFKEVTVDLFVNAVYTASSLVMQKSLKEGFGLTVTEAMWKGKAVIGGQTTGIALQIKHGRNGFLVSSVEEAAEYLIRLLKDSSLREKIGQAAQESVKEKFLLSRFVLDHLKIYSRL